MAHRFQVVIDSVEPTTVAEFWRTALGYVAEPPPPGYQSWPEFAAANSIPPDRWADAAVDPDGVGPRLFFPRVPEPKAGKNRVHVDVAVGAGLSGAQRRDRVDSEVTRLCSAGAEVVRRVEEGGGYFVVMRDPEGNEFCVQ